jgi:tetratricopeptide (TPR) repeat protein
MSALLLAFGAPLQAQTVRGQIFMPDGSQPKMQLRFYLTSSDGRVNEYHYTDTLGRFVLERLNGLVEWTITVESDGQTYATTYHNFTPGNQAPVRFFLNRLPSKDTPKEKPPAPVAKQRPHAHVIHEEGMNKVQENKLDEAEKLFKQAIAEDAKFPEPLFALGALYTQLKKLPEAEKAIRQGLALDAKSAYGQLSLGIVLARANRFEEAIAPLRESLILNKDLVSGHLYLGIALAETDSFEEAERHLTESVGVPGTEEALRQMYLGQVYARTGRYERSIASFEAYLLKMPAAKNAADVRALIEKMKQELARPK